MNSIFILIILWGGNGADTQRAITAIEFNSEGHCKTAASLVEKGNWMQVICVPKGPEIKPATK